MGSSQAEEALERLLAGNHRFMTGLGLHPDQTLARRLELVAGQHPFAAILGCADSRVPPEIIFDQGLGDLFSVRVAGNILDESVLGSLEYAVLLLEIPLIVVLGHSSCGAVQAAMSASRFEGQIAKLATAIHPAVDQARTTAGLWPDRVLAQAVKINAARVASQLRASAPVLAPRVEAGAVKIQGAYYDIASGQVELLQ